MGRLHFQYVVKQLINSNLGEYFLFGHEVDLDLEDLVLQNPQLAALQTSPVSGGHQPPLMIQPVRCRVVVGLAVVVDRFRV